eukprot:1683817-Rhodomonas_salina.1
MRVCAALLVDVRGPTDMVPIAIAFCNLHAICGPGSDVASIGRAGARRTVSSSKRRGAARSSWCTSRSATVVSCFGSVFTCAQVQMLLSCPVPSCPVLCSKQTSPSRARLAPPPPAPSTTAARAPSMADLRHATDAC